jgi:hypothetical protein
VNHKMDSGIVVILITVALTSIAIALYIFWPRTNTTRDSVVHSKENFYNPHGQRVRKAPALARVKH